MSSVTDMPFRILCKKYGASLVYSEMVSSEAVIRGAAHKKFQISEMEKPIAIQLFGGNETSFSKASMIVEKAGADIIDINMGCPYPTIMKQSAGSELLRKPDKVRKIITSVLKAVNIPLTIKTRIGIKRLDEGLKVAKIAESAGASAVAIHGRTVNQAYKGKCDLDAIKKIKESLNIPVIGSGDVFSPQDAERMLNETGCDFVMIGRGAMGNPFIFDDMKNYFKSKKLKKPTGKKKIDAFLGYVKIAKKNGVLDFKSAKIQLNYFTKGIKNSSGFRLRISKIKDFDNMMEEVNSFRKIL